MRPPAVAGAFYPGRPAAVAAALRRLVPTDLPRTTARAIVVPHAGWTYSGAVAGEVYARVSVPRLVVVLAPNHTGRGPEGSIMSGGRWAIPGAEVPIAEALAEAIRDVSGALEEDEAAHRHEHAIEVQLPFLRWVRPDVAFVPIVLGRDDLAFCLEVGRAVASAVAGLAEPVLLVCSTDLNHYEPRAVSSRKDRLAIEAILAGEPAGLLATVRAHDISMCGAAPAAATLAALGGGRGELVRYATSGDVSGDDERVVGYAGLILS